MNRNHKIILVSFAAGIIIGGFQNCSGVNFNAIPQSKVAQNQPNNVADVPTPTPTPTPNPVPTPVPSPTPSCPQGSIFDGHQCVPQNPGTCLKYTELVPVSSADPSFLGSFTIPARDATQECFYIHLIGAIDINSPINSNNWKTFRNDVMSRYHVTTNDSPAVLSQLTSPPSHANFHPRIIGSTANSNGSINLGATASAQFSLQGTRTVTLSGNSAGNIPMQVDNFILLEMNSQTKGQEDLAEGTADALPYADPNNLSSTTTGPITVGGQPISFISFGPGGTTNVDPKDISSFLPLNDPISIKATGLDCGGVGGISDIYLLFQ